MTNGQNQIICFILSFRLYSNPQKIDIDLFIPAFNAFLEDHQESRCNELDILFSIVEGLAIAITNLNLVIQLIMKYI